MLSLLFEIFDFGNQEYVFAPFTFIVAESPSQIVVERGFILIIGFLFTIISILLLFLQLFASVPTTVYVIVFIGFAFTIAPVVLSREVAGDQIIAICS